MQKNYRAELVGVFGDPVDLNPTGAIEEAAFQAAGLNFRYITAKVFPKDLQSAILGMRAMNMRGVNLTMPHKVEVIPMLDGLTEAAEIIGAVNTVYLNDGKYIGENTDGKGFVRALEMEGVSLRGKTVALLGAGGAGKAIGVECALAGADKIIVINRNAERGQLLADTISRHTPAQSAYLPWGKGMPVPEGAQILINATCIGLSPNDQEKPDIDYASIKSDMVVCDVVFHPEYPPFLMEAEKRGAKTVTGLGMLACQAARNFTLWTGVDAPFDVLLNALRAEMQG